MSETLEVRTAHADIGDLVQDLASRVDDVSIRLSSSRTIGEGEWVRFVVRLRDGSAALEGVGRCQSVKRAGAGFELLLSLLQFDERNEVMYERILIARDT
ncbi:MAG: hypothetical protein K8H88_15300, partial [Sandaracinaceae bacterium]|nr:hypothetical protein [Sandaracinaceae bacterium]